MRQKKMAGLWFWQFSLLQKKPILTYFINASSEFVCWLIYAQCLSHCSAFAAKAQEQSFTKEVYAS